MKKILKQFSILAAGILFFQSFASAQVNDNEKDKKYDFVKTKSVNKSYNVSSADELNIQNSFGAVEVHTWNKNEIKVDVSVEVSATKEALAQKLIDAIQVNNEQAGKEISFKTDIKNANNNDFKNEKSTMRINYSISMPASNPLKIKNEFGATTIPDFNGEIELVSKFGSLKTGNLVNVKKLQTEFGKADIGNISNGDISIKYSKFTIGRVSGDVKINAEFCGMGVINLDDNLKSLDVKASYSSVNLRPVSDLAASYNIKTSFGSFKNRSKAVFNEEGEDDDLSTKFNNEYNGKYGKATIPVKVKSSFSTIILGEPTADDMKKDKSKRKKTVSL